jgi:hypothetical protein
MLAEARRRKGAAARRGQGSKGDRAIWRFVEASMSHPGKTEGNS